MAIYSQTAKQQLVDLINEGNPDLPFPLNTVDYDFTNPVTLSTPLENGHNTEIRVIAKPSAPYTGNVLLTYRRLNLAYLFRGVIPTVRKWTPSAGGNDTQQRIYLHDLLPLFTKKYGILLDPSQIQNVGLDGRFGLYPDNYNLYMRAEATSPIFVGQTGFKWIIGERTLSDLLSVDDVDGRHWPGGDDFSGDTERKVYMTPLTYNTDFTMYKQENGRNWDYSDLTWYSGANGNEYYQQNNYVNILDPLMRAAFGFGISKDDNFRNYYTTGKDAYGDVYVGYIRSFVLTLPNANYPEANSEFYNRAIMIEIPEDCPWGTGTIFLHYNV